MQPAEGTKAQSVVRVSTLLSAQSFTWHVFLPQRAKSLGWLNLSPSAYGLGLLREGIGSFRPSHTPIHPLAQDSHC